MQIESTFEYPISVLGRSEENHLLVRLKTPPVVQGNRQPLIVGLAIDKSWSMRGDKMEAVLEAASSLVNWLTRLDYVAVIAYSNDIQIVQPLVNLTEKVTIADKIRNIQVATSTNLSGGWLQTLRAIEAKKVEGSFRRVILLTDGNPTLGVKDPEQLVQIAKDHAARGISTTTIGVGDDFNEHMLKSIAEAGGGNFYFIDNPEQASDIFFQEFGDIGALYAQALELKIQFPSELKFKSVINNFAYELSEDISELRGDVGGISKQTITIQAGDIRSDDIKNVLVSFENTVKLSKEAKIDLEVSYYNLLDGMKIEKVSATTELNVNSSGSKQDPDVLVEILVVETANLILKASDLLRSNNNSEAKTIVQEQIAKLSENKHYSPNTLGGLLNRLEVLETKIQENTSNVSKLFMASGTNLSNRGSEVLDMKDVSFHDDIFIYETKGDIDLYKCPEIKTHMQEKMKSGYRFIIMDLKDTSHIDSSAIGTLIQIVGWMRRRGGELVVSGLKDSVKKVFEITKLYNHIRVAETLADSKELIQRILVVREGDKN
ncbi:MAG: anti-sigma factor antagonist [Leptospira sp.]|nr:anti-sigma factor antagonist [Leptospira sp.]